MSERSSAKSKSKSRVNEAGNYTDCVSQSLIASKLAVKVAHLGSGLLVKHR